jgi:hypothetical protein
MIAPYKTETVQSGVPEMVQRLLHLILMQNRNQILNQKKEELRVYARKGGNGKSPMSFYSILVSNKAERRGKHRFMGTDTTRTAGKRPLAYQGDTRMRTVLIRIDRAKRRQIRKLQLEPGTKVSDVLQALNVQGFILARATDPMTPLPTEAEIHSLVCDSDHLIARSRSAPVENADSFRLTIAH